MNTSSIESAIRTLLISSGSITDIVGDRIYPNDTDNSVSMPYIVYELDNDQGDVVRSTLRDAELTITVVAEEYSVCKAVQKAITGTLDVSKSNFIPGSYDGVAIRGAFLSTTQDAPNKKIIDGENTPLFGVETTWKIFYMG